MAEQVNLSEQEIGSVLYGTHKGKVVTATVVTLGHKDAVAAVEGVEASEGVAGVKAVAAVPASDVKGVVISGDLAKGYEKDQASLVAATRAVTGRYQTPPFWSVGQADPALAVGKAKAEKPAAPPKSETEDAAPKGRKKSPAQKRMIEEMAAGRVEPSGTDEYECTTCHAIFPLPEEMLRHLDVAHPAVPAPSGDPEMAEDLEQSEEPVAV